MSAKTKKKPARRKPAPRVLPEPVPVEALRWRCDPDGLPFESTGEVEAVTGVVGQDDAVEAVRYGLESTGLGKNIFVRGLSGTGRLTLVRRLLEEIQPTCPLIKDRVYVHNFKEPERPRLITLPVARGQVFRRMVDKLADFIRDDLGTALSSEGIRARRGAIEQSLGKQLKELVGPLEQRMKDAGLTLVNVEAGPVTQTVVFPVVDGKAVPPEEFERLHSQGEITDEHYKAARDSFAELQQQLADVNEKALEIRKEHAETIGKLMEEAARSILQRMVHGIAKAFPEPAVQTFLAELVDDVVDLHLDDLAGEEGDFTWLYRANVVLEHKVEGACPIIVENTPTVRNLLGTIDPDFESDRDAKPSHLGIRAGSLLRADGGFLILEDREVLGEPGAWKVLKRVLRTNRLEITPPSMVFPGWTPSLKPEAIEINVKVVMLGDPEIYFLLDQYDADFPQLFKILADFDSVIPRDETGVRQYAGVFARIVSEQELPPLDRTAVAALAEYGARIASAHGKLTARFGRLADIVGEAAFVARKRRAGGGDDGKTLVVTGEDVRQAVRRARRRADLPARRFRELVADRTIWVDTVGSVVGQVNGLAVLQSGPMVYGFPTRITATIGPGTAGVINIEGEAALSGAIHTKGFHILGGLLRFLLRTDHPLAFNASVGFEQSYGSIDGDSASGAEICCLLSALTDLPLRQDVAMTGAIDQMGHILAVGAVNEKIEGFFDACCDLGLAGTQGVIIPQANVGGLMLREDVVEACAANTFRVYAVRTVQEALAILTGRRSGERTGTGAYPKGSVLALALERAREYWLKAARPAPRGARKQTAKRALARAVGKRSGAGRR
jgi:ATP-dependent Lon protease